MELEWKRPYPGLLSGHPYRVSGLVREREPAFARSFRLRRNSTGQAGAAGEYKNDGQTIGWCDHKLKSAGLQVAPILLRAWSKSHPGRRRPGAWKKAESKKQKAELVRGGRKRKSDGAGEAGWGNGNDG